MQSLFTASCEPDSKKSCGDDHPGLEYSSAYYEDEPLCSENTNPPNEPCQHLEPNFIATPIRINKRCCTNIDLPPIIWHRYNSVPNTLNVTNTGRTILINGQWTKGKPYIEGGPLNGTYIFSQIHFHCPSEHEVGGQRYPLEMHVVHHKTCYLTQEKAMLEKDGTVVLVYLFQVIESEPTPMSSVTNLAPKIEKVNSQTETKNIALEQIVQPFTSNYYIYWGSVSSNKSSYLLQWIINGCILCVTQKEADDLLAVMNFDECSTVHPRVKPENDAVFFVDAIEEDVEVIKQCAVKEELEISFCQAAVQCCHDCGTQDSYQPAVILNKNEAEVCPAKKEEVCAKQYKCTRLSGMPVKFCCVPRRRLKNSDLRKIKKNRNKCCVQELDLCTSSVPQTCENTEDECSCVSSKERCKSCSDDDSYKKCVKKCEKKCEKKCKKTKPEKAKSKEETCHRTETEEEVCEKEKSEEKMCKKQESEEKTCEKKKKAEPKCEKKKKEPKCEKTKKSEPKCEKTKKAEPKCEKKKKEPKCEKKKKEPKCEKKKKEPKCDKKKREKKTESECSEISDSSNVKDCQSTSKKKKEKKKQSKCPKETESAATCANVDENCSKQENTFATCNEKVECRMASVTSEKTFDEILREYNSSWLETDSIFEDKNVCDLASKNSRGTEKFYSPMKTSPVDSGYALTTLFEKKRNNKTPEPTSGAALNVSGSNLPSESSGSVTSSVANPKNLGEIKCTLNSLPKNNNNEPELIVNSVIVSTSKEKAENSNKSAYKDFCIQVELLFRSKNEDFSGCLAQEYNLTLICGQNVLQEYKGTLYPGDLVLGNYEKLILLPKYPELDDICVRLQDCTAKMESLDQICMRAKFLLKKVDFKDFNVDFEKPGSTLVADAETQCCLKEPQKYENANAMVSRKKNLPTIEKEIKITSENSTPTCSNMIKQVSEELELSESFDPLICEDGQLEYGECKIKLVKNSSIHGKENSKTIIFNSVQPPNKSIKKEEQINCLTEYPNKKTTHINPKKTVYFAYERIEKDKNTGKTIFIGNFRKKEELDTLSQEKKKKEPERKEREKVSADEESSHEILTIKGPKKVVDSRTLSEYSLQSAATTTIFKKESDGNRQKQEPLNSGSYKIHSEEDNDSFKHLASVLGVHNDKIAIYRLRRACENEDLDVVSIRKTPTKKENFLINSQGTSCGSREFNAKSEELSKNESSKSLVRKRSNGALIIIPVNSRRISNVEVIVIERSGASKKESVNSEKEIPCLKFNR